MFVQNAYCISFYFQFLRDKLKHPLFDWNMAALLIHATKYIYIYGENSENIKLKICFCTLILVLWMNHFQVLYCNTCTSFSQLWILYILARVQSKYHHILWVFSGWSLVSSFKDETWGRMVQTAIPLDKLYNE